ncbi:MAG: type III secretion system chaperone [Betaproteobacteria bacterium]
MNLPSSNPQDSVNHWLADFAQAEGMVGLQLDERGLIGLQVDNALEIEIEVPGEQGLLYLRAALMPVPAQDRESLYARLLACNFLLQDCNGAAFAIDAERALLALSLCQPVSKLDGLDFANLLRNFIDVALRWQAQLTQELQAGLPDDGPASLPFGR